MAADTANSYYGLSHRTTLLKLRKGSRLLSSDTVFHLKMLFSNRKQTLSEDINHCRRCFGVCHRRMRDNTLSDVIQTQSRDEWIGNRSMLLVEIILRIYSFDRMTKELCHCRLTSNITLKRNHTLLLVA